MVGGPSALVQQPGFEASLGSSTTGASKSATNDEWRPGNRPPFAVGAASRRRPRRVSARARGNVPATANRKAAHAQQCDDAESATSARSPHRPSQSRWLQRRLATRCSRQRQMEPPRIRPDAPRPRSPAAWAASKRKVAPRDRRQWTRSRLRRRNCEGGRSYPDRQRTNSAPPEPARDLDGVFLCHHYLLSQRR